MLDRKVVGVVHLSLSYNDTLNIAKEMTATSLMEVLANIYKKPYAMNKVHLIHHLFNLRIVKSVSMTEHLNEFNTITT